MFSFPKKRQLIYSLKKFISRKWKYQIWDSVDYFTTDSFGDFQCEPAFLGSNGATYCHSFLALYPLRRALGNKLLCGAKTTRVRGLQDGVKERHLSYLCDSKASHSQSWQLFRCPGLSLRYTNSSKWKSTNVTALGKRPRQMQSRWAWILRHSGDSG